MAAILFLVLTILFSAKFLFLNTYVQTQKNSLRDMAFQSQSPQTQVIFINKQELFKDKIGFEWKDDFKEVKILNVYYEVVLITRMGDQYRIILLEDTAESDLFFVVNHQDEDPSHANFAAPILSDFFLPSQHQWGLTNSIPLTFGFKKNPLLQQGYFNELSKPPIASIT